VTWLLLIVSGGTVSTSQQADGPPVVSCRSPAGGPCDGAEAPLVTVEMDAVRVERRLIGGRLACPDCGGVLAGWGHGRERTLRGVNGPVRVRPRRSRCVGCYVTHVLLRWGCWCGGGGSGCGDRCGVGRQSSQRRVSVDRVELGRTVDTVRGWLRRFAGRVERCDRCSRCGCGCWCRIR